MNPALSGQALDDAIAARPFPKVTPQQIKDRIMDVEYLRLGETVTICNITLDNGYSVRGESACVDPQNYDQAIGESLAYKQAEAKIWPLEGYLLAEARSREAVMPITVGDRLRKEKAELDAKSQRLATFISGDKFKEIVEPEQARLRTQLRLMCEYSAVLGDRIQFQVEDEIPF